MSAISSLLPPNLYQNPKDRIVVSKPPDWLAIGASARSSRALGSSISFSNPTRKTLWISAVASEAAATAREPEAARRLYVGNIPRSVGNEELARIFGENASVEKTEVMYDRYSGRSRRLAFVTMSTVEDANAAIEKLNDTEIGGRKIKVYITEKPLPTVDLSLLQAEESKFIDSPNKVYVANILCQQEIGGRKIKVNITEKPLPTVDLSLLQAEESKLIDRPNKVYVANLAKTTSDL